MKKTAFKTFVYSFSFSLLTIFGVNRAFFYIPKYTTNKPLEIPNKNITLFLKNNDFSSINAVAAPRKKIVLSALNDIEKSLPIAPTQTQKAEDIKLASAEKIAMDMPVFVKEKKDFINIPLDKPRIDLTLDTNSTPLKKVSQDSTRLTSKEQTPAKPNKKIVYQPSIKSQEPQDNPITIAASPDIAKEETKLVSAQTSRLSEKETIQPSQRPEFSVEDEIIPLENGNSSLLANAKIINSQETSSSQVALTPKDIPIKSMGETKPLSTSNQKSSKASTPNWQQMEDKQTSAQVDDSPWLVAKGNSFPNNQMVLEDEAYKKSEEDIKKIFTPTQTVSDSEPIQLAAETVQNLLIPIPEEIMKEENIVPQLVSSPQNQEIKEKLEEKGLIKEAKTEPAQIKPAPQKNSTPSDKTNNVTENSSQEKSFLNSLTSLFSSNDENLPEIGINEDEDSNKNSLFSAFTRKQNRLMTKILPTEIRLSFQPNRAEISGQTLKWIKAFAQKTAEEPTTGLEIRIDGTSSPLLQRRRLNLLQNILYNEGALPEKINTVFTAREPNSFILRTVRLNVEKNNATMKNAQRYMHW